MISLILFIGTVIMSLLLYFYLKSSTKPEGSNVRIIKVFAVWALSIPAIAIVLALVLMVLILVVSKVRNFELSGAEWVIPLLITTIASPLLALIPAIKYYRKEIINKKAIVILLAILATIIAIQVILSVVGNFLFTH